MAFNPNTARNVDAALAPGAAPKRFNPKAAKPVDGLRDQYGAVGAGVLGALTARPKGPEGAPQPSLTDIGDTLHTNVGVGAVSSIVGVGRLADTVGRQSMSPLGAIAGASLRSLTQPAEPLADEGVYRETMGLPAQNAAQQFVAETPPIKGNVVRPVLESLAGAVPFVGEDLAEWVRSKTDPTPAEWSESATPRRFALWMSQTLGQMAAPLAINKVSGPAGMLAFGAQSAQGAGSQVEKEISGMPLTANAYDRAMSAPMEVMQRDPAYTDAYVGLVSGGMTPRQAAKEAQRMVAQAASDAETKIWTYPGFQEEMAQAYQELKAQNLPGTRAPQLAKDRLATKSADFAAMLATPVGALSGYILGGSPGKALATGIASNMVRGGFRPQFARAVTAPIVGAAGGLSEGLQEVTESGARDIGKALATGVAEDLGRDSAADFVGGFGMGAVTNTSMPDADSLPPDQRTLDPFTAAEDEDARDNMLRTADPDLVDIVNGRPRAGLLAGPPGPPAWRVDANGNVAVPGTTQLRLPPGRPGAGADFVGSADGALRRGPGIEIAPEASTYAPQPGVVETDSSLRGPGIGPAPVGVPVQPPGARVDARSGAVISVPAGREMVRLDENGRPVLPPEPRADAGPPADQPELDDEAAADAGSPADQPELDDEAAADAEIEALLDESGPTPPAVQQAVDALKAAQGAASALGPRPAVTSRKAPPAVKAARAANLRKWQAEQQRLTAAEDAAEKALINARFVAAEGDPIATRRLLLTIDPLKAPERFGLPASIAGGRIGKVDLLRALAKAGGLDRAAFSAQFDVDPSQIAQLNKASPVGRPLFRKAGEGLTPDAAIEIMEQEGFLADQGGEGVVRTNDQNAAFDLIEAAMNGREVRAFLGESSETQEIQGQLDGIKKDQSEFAVLQGTRRQEEAEAAEMQMSRAGLRSLVRQMESEGQISREPPLQDRDALTVSEWARRAEGAGVDVDDVADLFTNWTDAPTFVRAVTKLIQENGRADTEGSESDRAAGVRRGGEAQARRQGADRRARSRDGGPDAETEAETDALRAEVDRLNRELRTSKLGIRNRRAFEEDESLGWPAVAAADMDGIKRINDTLGHDAGDKVMQRVADDMLEASGESIRFYHLNGDEFAARATNTAALEQAMTALQAQLAATEVLIDPIDDKSQGLVYDGIGLTYGTGANYEQADQQAIQSKRDRIASGERQDPRGDGPPRNLRGQADPAGLPSSRDGVSPGGQNDRSSGVPVTPDPAPDQDPASAGFLLSGPAAPAPPPAPRFGVQPDMPAPATSADANLGTAPAPQPSSRSLALIQLTVPTTDGDMQAPADKVLSAQRKRIAALDSLINCLRS